MGDCVAFYPATTVCCPRTLADGYLCLNGSKSLVRTSWLFLFILDRGQHSIKGRSPGVQNSLKLVFEHPYTGKRMKLEAPIKDDFKKAWKAVKDGK